MIIETRDDLNTILVGCGCCQPFLCDAPDRECESALATALSAHALSISPGEVVVEIDPNGVMYTHVLDVTHSAEYQEQAQQMRNDLLSKIIE